MTQFKDTQIRVINFTASEANPVIYYSLVNEKELFEAKEVATIVRAEMVEGVTKVRCIYEVDGGRYAEQAVKFYLSEMSFRSGDNYEGEEISLFNYTFHGFNHVSTRYDRGLYSMDHYVFCNGKAAFIEVNKYFTNGKSTWTQGEGEVLLTFDNTYSCPEHAYKYNPYTIVHANGEEEVRQPVMELIKLTPEQRTALDKVKDAMKEAENLGVKFYYDLENSDMYAFNGLHIKEITWDDIKEDDKPFTVDTHDISKVEYNSLPRVTDMNGDTHIIINH